MKKLRIATMVATQYTTPPPKGEVYAPMDIAVAVSRGLAEKGHEVTYFAPIGSMVDGVKIETLGLEPLSDSDVLKDMTGQGAEPAKIYNLWDQYMIANMFRQYEEGKFDILHIHPVDRALPLGLANPKANVFYTLHDPIDEWRRVVYKMFNSKNQRFISISNAQRHPALDINWADTIYNGVDINKFSFSPNHEDYFLFVGRLHDKKGIVEAVEAARTANTKLVIIGPIRDKKLWAEKIEPYIDNKNIIYPGFVSIEELVRYYQKAKAILVPIKWEEPFGLVMTEAMSCGTPVIAFNRGSVPEIVEDGKNGFIVENVEEMVNAMGKIDSINRADCRKSVEEKFSIEKMVDGYEQAFLELI